MAFGDYPALMDPRTMGILSAAFAGLNASGPQRMPTSLGQVIGQGGQAGLGTYMGALDAERKNAQTQALIDLEKQKAIQAELATRVQFEDHNMRRGMLGLPPIPMPGGQMQAQPSAQPLPFGGPQPIPQPLPQMGAPAQPQPMGPAAGGPNIMQAIQSLPPDLRQAAIADIGMNGGKGLAGILAKAGEPVIGREGGLYKRDSSGNLTIDPGFLQGEQQLRRVRSGIESENTLVDVPMPDGTVRKMTKADALKMANPQELPYQDALAVAKDRMARGQPVTIGYDPATAPKMPGFGAGQSTASRSAAEASGSEAGKVQKEIDTEAASALQSRKILGEMKMLVQDFNPSKVAPVQRALGEWAQALNLPGNWEKEIKAAESQQALQKLTAQMATAAMKQFTNRGTQMEFRTFLQNNPNAELTPGGFQKVLEFMDKVADSSIQKQQAYIEWKKANPLEKSQDFLADWNKAQNAALAEPAPQKGPPKAGTVIDGWEFVGGDPGNRMNWRKK